MSDLQPQDSGAKKRSVAVKRGWLSFLSITIVAGILFLCFMPGPHDKDVTVMIPAGIGFRGSVAQLREAEVLRTGPGFMALAVASGKARSFKAGEYLVPARATAWQIVRLLSEGRTIVRRVTIPEGWTVKEIFTGLGSAPGLTGALPEGIKEGTLLPETYHYRYGDSRAALVARMQENMRKTLAALWPARDPLVPLKTPQQALILASLVEEETGVAAERPRVAAVFYNRLRIGMRLQTDPSVLYGLGRGRADDRRGLSSRDLQSDTPYNTYLIDGLPPGPIACPGRAALEAVLHPAVSEELYFVADGAGGHRFAKTLEEHNANVQLYRAQLKQTRH